MNNLKTNILAKEYINEVEYIRINGGTLLNIDYNNKMQYINKLRAELFNRGYKSWGDIINILNK